MEPEALVKLIDESKSVTRKDASRMREMEKHLCEVLTGVFKEQRYTDDMKRRVLIDLARKPFAKGNPRTYRLFVSVFMLPVNEGRITFKITKTDAGPCNVELEYSFIVTPEGEIEVQKFITAAIRDVE